MNSTRILGAIALFCMSGVSAYAADPVKIGLVTTMSGPAGYLGQEIKDGFELAVAQGGGELGGVPVTVDVQDDNFEPGQAKQIVDHMISDQGVRLLTGIVFSNVLTAALPDIVDEGAFYISPSAAPSNFAGKDCDKNYFVVAKENETLFEAAGQYANDLKFDSAFLLAPNFQAGKDAITGFKRYFKGKLVGEIFTQLDQTDFSAELAKIRAAKPAVVFQFHPGGLGITFLRQYQQSGLIKDIPMIAPELDSRMLEAVGSAALGLNVVSQWNADLDNDANKAFVKAWMDKYGRLPTTYAAQGYDAAQLYGSALKATAGDVSNADAFRDAMRKADFKSVRGNFAFAANQHPKQDWYGLRVEQGSDGKPFLKTVATVFKDHADANVQDCKM